MVIEIGMKIDQSNSMEDLIEKSAVALGYFDGVHLGHAAVIKALKGTGYPVVVLTFAQHPGNHRVMRLMNNELKEEAFAALGVSRTVYLDYPLVKDMSPVDFISKILSEKLHAAYVGCGFNYRFGRGAAAGAEDLEKICAEYAIKTVCVDPVYTDSVEDLPVSSESASEYKNILHRTPISSTLIRGLIRDGEVRRAGIFMGRPFALFYPVVSGRQLGRTLGTPTLNQNLPEGDILPRFGVYASFSTVDGKKRPSITNVGVRPTVGSDCVVAETYILDYHGDLYGQKIKVELIDFIRDEKKFASIEALQNQMKADTARVKKMTANDRSACRIL